MAWARACLGARCGLGLVVGIRCQSREIQSNQPNQPDQPTTNRQAYTEICDKLVSENVFSQYIYKTLPSCNHLWVFKKTFCMQMALSGGWGGRGLF